MDDFGERVFLEGSDVYAHNAWDDYEWTEEREQKALAQVLETSSEQVDEERKKELDEQAAYFWEEFYSKHQSKFFKDRKWLQREFPELFSGFLPVATAPDSHSSPNTSYKILEVGCGVGNTVLPLIESCKGSHTFIYACDFSSTAICILQKTPEYALGNCLAFTQDITTPNTNWPFPPGSIDAICLIFVLSALSPEKFGVTVKNLCACLRPGGMIFLRDYGRYDMAQLRFKNGRCISENFYFRGDGTCVYFFQQDELRNLFTANGLTEVTNTIDRRLIVNRKRRLTMYRVWVQCKYQKPTNAKN